MTSSLPAARTRRQFLRRSGFGFGCLAFQAMFSDLSAADTQAKSSQLAAKKPHLRARAKRVIFLNMDGGPSSLETFNPKSKLSVFPSQQHGEAGLPVTNLFPHLSQHVDDLCLLHGMHCDSPDHINASIQLHCGKHLSSRPSMGSWIVYGLGTENENVPGFITINPSSNGAGSKLYNNSFIPAVYAGTPIGESLVLSDSTNAELTESEQRQVLDRLQARNRHLLERHQQSTPLNGLLSAFELAFCMQVELPGLLSVNDESQRTLDAYGLGQPVTDSFGRQCLVARRLCEAGVRFIEITNSTWDHHSNIATLLPNKCLETDQPIAALLSDLKQRGLLKDTLVLWGGEFGRTKTEKEKTSGGSGHNNRGYTMWMAGGGVKPGFAFGQTDDEGWEAIDGRVHTHDLHATLLHLLGLDHEKLTYHFAGRAFRLTDVAGNVVRQVLS